MNTCIGTKILNEINPTNSPIERDRIISQANTIINRDYKFMGYLQFANYIENKIKSDGYEKELVNKNFSNSLIVIDEVHNCTKESKTLSQQLKKLAKYADNVKMILLSATPMYNSPREIIWIINLMNMNDRRTTIKYSDVFDKKGNLITPKKSEDVGANLLLRKLNGYVSYVRGENPYTFPFRIYPSFERRFITMDTKKEVETPLHGKIYLTEIGEEQKKVYTMVMNKSLDKGDGLFNVVESPDFENMERLGYTKLQGPLQSLIITFPHKDFESIISNESDNRYTELFGQKGLENNMYYEKKDIKVENTAKITIKCNYEYKPDAPHIFSSEELPKYSAKIASVCDCIRASVNRTVEIDGIQTVVHGGIIIVYTQYIYGGIVPMALALEEMGFVRHGQNSLFRPGFIKNRIDSNTMKLKEDVNPSEFKQAKYMIISGDKHFSQNNAEDIKIATSKKNKYGEEVRVILISRAASEGLDFKYIRQVHILDPWYNLNRIEQIIGRGVRNRSHCGLIFEERNVEIYLHATTNGEVETADLYVYRYAETKAEKIGMITRIMKTVSVDCILNHSQTNFTDKEMEAVAKNGVVLITQSTGNTLIPYKLGDKPFSSVCDYMDNCEYKCYPEKELPKPTTYDEMYDKEQISMNSAQILDKIKTIFKKENAYHIDTIQEMDLFKTINKEELYYALTYLIDGPENIQDKNGRIGRLINRGLYYFFQPINATNQNTSFYESTIPVKTLNERVQYQIETNDENIKTPAKQQPISEEYSKLITEIKKNMENATNDEPNDILTNGDDYDWYYNLNSRNCKKELGELDKFKKKHKLKDNDEEKKKMKRNEYEREYILEQTKKLSKNDQDEYILLMNGSLCNSVMTRLRFLGFTKSLLEKYVVEHILDTLPHESRIILAKTVLTPGFSQNSPLEKQVFDYFNFLVLDGGKAIVLTKEEENIYYNTSNWKELSYGEKVQLDAEMHRKMDVSDYSDIVGFIAKFAGKDMISKMVFKRKDMKQKRNNQGAYLQNDSKKAAVIDKVNEILRMGGYPFQFDDSTNKEATRNTDDISKIAFSGIFEMLIRKMNEEKKDGKTWFLKPEQAIFNNIKNA
jgi:hypothetical protein